MRRSWLLALLLGSAPAGAYVAGKILPHAHSGSSSGGSITNLRLGGYLDVVNYMVGRSSFAVEGSTFSVGGSSFVVVGGRSGFGTSNPNEGKVVISEVSGATLTVKVAATATGSQACLMFKSDTGTTDALKKTGVCHVDDGTNGVADLRVLVDDSTDGNSANIDDNTIMIFTHELLVGLGTQAPAEKFHIDGGNFKVVNISTISTNLGTNAQLKISKSDAGTANIIYENVGVEIFRTFLNNTEGFLATSADGGTTPHLGVSTGGLVGIGTDSPETTLQVAGPIGQGISTISSRDTDNQQRYALCWDGAEQSSGTLVALWYNGQGADAELVMSSTNSVTGAQLGVTAEPCTPGYYSRVITGGPARITAGGAVTRGNALTTYTTRGAGYEDATTSTSSGGRWMSTTASGQVGWVWINGK